MHVANLYIAECRPTYHPLHVIALRGCPQRCYSTVSNLIQVKIQENKWGREITINSINYTNLETMRCMVNLAYTQNFSWSEKLIETGFISLFFILIRSHCTSCPISWVVLELGVFIHYVRIAAVFTQKKEC